MYGYHLKLPPTQRLPAGGDTCVYRAHLIGLVPGDIPSLCLPPARVREGPEVGELDLINSALFYPNLRLESSRFDIIIH